MRTSCQTTEARAASLAAKGLRESSASASGAAAKLMRRARALRVTSRAAAPLPVSRPAPQALRGHAVLTPSLSYISGAPLMRSGRHGLVSGPSLHPSPCVKISGMRLHSHGRDVQALRQPATVPRRRHAGGRAASAAQGSRRSARGRVSALAQAPARERTQAESDALTAFRRKFYMLVRTALAPGSGPAHLHSIALQTLRLVVRREALALN